MVACFTKPEGNKSAESWNCRKTPCLEDVRSLASGLLFTALIKCPRSLAVKGIYAHLAFKEHSLPFGDAVAECVEGQLWKYLD